MGWDGMDVNSCGDDKGRGAMFNSAMLSYECELCYSRREIRETNPLSTAGLN